MCSRNSLSRFEKRFCQDRHILSPSILLDVKNFRMFYTNHSQTDTERTTNYRRHQQEQEEKFPLFLASLTVSNPCDRRETEKKICKEISLTKLAADYRTFFLKQQHPLCFTEDCKDMDNRDDHLLIIMGDDRTFDQASADRDDRKVRLRSQIAHFSMRERIVRQKKLQWTLDSYQGIDRKSVSQTHPTCVLYPEGLINQWSLHFVCWTFRHN